MRSERRSQRGMPMRCTTLVAIAVTAIAIAAAPRAESCVEPFPDNIQMLFLRTGEIPGAQGEAGRIAFEVTMFGGAAYGDVGGTHCGCVLALPSRYFGNDACTVDSATITDPN